MTSNAVQRPQTSGALRVAAAWARLRCSASSTMSRHRLDRRPLHPGPRRSQRDPRDFHHGLLEAAGSIIGFGPERFSFGPSALTCLCAKIVSGVLVSRIFPSKEGFDFGFLIWLICPQE